MRDLAIIARSRPARVAGWALAAILALAAVTVYGVALWRAPGWAHAITAQDRYNARVLVISVGGAIVVGTGLLYTARNYRLSRRGQVTDRFTSALERLGSSELYVRLGGVHALEHVMRDSADHHDDVIEVLTAFIRDRAPGSSQLDGQVWMHPVTGSVPDLPPYPTADIQAALTALAHRPHRPERGTIDLGWLYLVGAWLVGASLHGARLSGADLTGAWLDGASLERLVGANLNYAHLTGASLPYGQLLDASLRGARLNDADLTHAVLMDTDLTRADLSGANLTGARLSGANLSGASLTGANLTRADLTGTQFIRVDFDGGWITGGNLTDADLSGANLTRAQFVDADLTGANLTGANLTGAQFTDTELTGAIWPSDEAVPEGWQRDDGGRLEWVDLGP